MRFVILALLWALLQYRHKRTGCWPGCYRGLWIYGWSGPDGAPCSPQCRLSRWAVDLALRELRGRRAA